MEPRSSLTWRRWVTGSVGDDLVRLDRGGRRKRTRTIKRRDDGGTTSPRSRPDGRTVACVYGTDGDPDHASPVAAAGRPETGRRRDVARKLDRVADDARLGGRRFGPSSSRPTTTAHTAAFRLDLAGERLTLLAAGSSFTDLCPSPDGSAVYALRST